MYPIVSAVAFLLLTTPLITQQGGVQSDEQAARVSAFHPQGSVKEIRQVQARFSESVVAFGDPRAEAPFLIDCEEPGTGRWVDSRNWVYDFSRDLPAGVGCVFTLKADLRSLEEHAFQGRTRFEFTTGGPGVLKIIPSEGSTVEEQQAFILELDGTPDLASLQEHAYFAVEGIGEKVAAVLLEGEIRDEVLKRNYHYRRNPQHTLLLLQPQRTLPADHKVTIVWDRGIRSHNGVETKERQDFVFQTRPAFHATFHCRREDADRPCIPLYPMWLRFSGPVAWKDAQRVRLTGEDGREYLPRQGKEDWVSAVAFQGPFPPESNFTVTIPEELVDDTRRALANRDRFPLEVATDRYPVLAKFAADFGILEAATGGVLPVTVRNVEREPAVEVLEFDAAGQSESSSFQGVLRGAVYPLPQAGARTILNWLDRLAARKWEDRDKSLLNGALGLRRLTIPARETTSAFEVIGIPLGNPGFYLVEMESRLLGEALLGDPGRPMFVSAAALVTNLAVHFKWGLDESLVWVTALSDARPRSGAAVEVFDCAGSSLASGRTDKNGVVRFSGLPSPDRVPGCGSTRWGGGLLVMVRQGNDMSFTHTSWDQGIEPWRFQLPVEYQSHLITAHTIFDRTLLRAGETLHMKHFLRRHLSTGLRLLEEQQKYSQLTIRHQGSGQEYSIPLEWDDLGTAVTDWDIPMEARLGRYSVAFSPPHDTSATRNWASYRRYSSEERDSGSFRVEEFRVPLFRGAIRPPAEDLVQPSSVSLDLSVEYLAGGMAEGLSARFRHSLQKGNYPSFEGFSGFTWTNGPLPDERLQADSKPPVTRDLTLDAAGGAKTEVSLPDDVTTPLRLAAELEFRDPNGEIQTVSNAVPIWPSHWLVGIKPEGWALARNRVHFQVAVTDLQGNPIKGAEVGVALFERRVYSHRKRLVGGFYGYEHSTEIVPHGRFCEGKTDERGRLFCDAESPVSGQVVLQASTLDPHGHASIVHRYVWVAGGGQWWFEVEDHDRIDVIAEEPRYEPGQKARFQVRMPFRKATALITVEREGVIDSYVRSLSGREPVIEIPVRPEYAPNCFVSVLVVRGRQSAPAPTSTVDLAKPAYKLGIAEIRVGWRAHELKVQVKPDQTVYKVRDQARVLVEVRTPEGKAPPPGSELAFAAVDEGLLELMPNPSWDLLAAIMGRRGQGVRTFTAQMQVVGKRHFGLKALPQGGGGGTMRTRELFDTLLFWKGRLPLDEQGTALVEVPINDSITSFRLVAMAFSGVDRFGSGEATIRTTQDLMLFSGVAPVVREGDRIRSEFTVRNASERVLNVRLQAGIPKLETQLDAHSLRLAPGESQVVGWSVEIPFGLKELTYEVAAEVDGAAADRIAVGQQVRPAVPVQTYAGTLRQLDGRSEFPVALPAGALEGRGGIRLQLSPTITGALIGVRDYMSSYPFTCLEQIVSKAVSLNSEEMWRGILSQLPPHLDSEGLLRYFPDSRLRGSEVLTAYVLAIAQERGWSIPENPRNRMLEGLRGFVEGRVRRTSDFPTADLSLRKLTAVEALTRYQVAEPSLVSSITIEPRFWPTSALLDWTNVLTRLHQLPERERLLSQVEQILRSRLNLQGTKLGFSSEGTDHLWWLMVSADLNAVRLILSLLETGWWSEDLPRVVSSASARMRRGHWDLTTANAWGTLALEKFAAQFEGEAVRGFTSGRLGDDAKGIEWLNTPGGGEMNFPWPKSLATLEVEHRGSRGPWLTLLSRAAIPLQQELSSNYRIRKEVKAVERRREDSWSVGDIVRVRLELEAQSDMTWVVVSDPIPAGATVLGTGLGRDSRLAARDEKSEGWVWPAFQERSHESFRSYYRFVPKGKWSVEYTMRLSSSGVLQLPPTRVEAMYAPEMFGEKPNPVWRVEP